MFMRSNRGEVSGSLESGLAPDGARRGWKAFKFPLPGPDAAKWIGGLAWDVTDVIHAQHVFPGVTRTPDPLVNTRPEGA